MQYEQFLFTRNQRQDFMAFVRPSKLTNKEVSTIGSIFNYVSDISKLTPELPSLYSFPLGEYLLLLRHYNSGRQHAGRAIGVIEGVAVPQSESIAFGEALPAFVADQASLLNVSASTEDINAQESRTSSVQEWRGSRINRPSEEFVGILLERRETDRLFLPFSETGFALLVTVLADRRFTIAPFFAFGTNSDVLAQLEQIAKIDVAAFFSTDRPAFHSRTNNRQTKIIDGYEPEIPTVDPSMALRSQHVDEMQLRPERKSASETTDDQEDSGDEADALSMRAPRREKKSIREARDADTTETSERAVLTMRQMRDQIRAEEAAARADVPQAEADDRNPIHWLLNAIASLLGTNKPK